MIIGIHGKKRAGKDTVAKFLQEHLMGLRKGPAVHVAWYATMLKEVCSSLSGVPLSWFYDEKLKESTIQHLDKTPRMIMTEMHDVLVGVFGSQVFVRPVVLEYTTEMLQSDLYGQPLVFIVADVRYDRRETDWIREEGGFIVHVRRNQTDPHAGTHSSELGVKIHPGDVVLHNNGTISELLASVRHLVLPKVPSVKYLTN